MHTHSHVTHPHVARIRIHPSSHMDASPSLPCKSDCGTQHLCVCTNYLLPRATGGHHHHVVDPDARQIPGHRIGALMTELSTTALWSPPDPWPGRTHSLTAPLRPAAPLALWMRARGANPSEHGRWQCDASGEGS